MAIARSHPIFFELKIVTSVISAERNVQIIFGVCTLFVYALEAYAGLVDRWLKFSNRTDITQSIPYCI